jgi:iron(III) transport system substrate-binding protein
MRSGFVFSSILAVTLLATACASPAPPPAAPAPTVAAASQAFSPAVEALIQGAQHETVLKGSWSPTSFGGSAGFDRLVQGMNRKYGLKIQAQFTPGIDEQAMAGRLAQEVAANQPPTEDIYLGNPAGVHDVIPTHAFKSVDWHAVIDRPIDPEGEFDPVAPDGAAVAFASSVVGITYNTNLVKPADVPHRLNDLLDPKWKGKIASTPYASGWREFVAPDLLGPDTTLSFVHQFAPQLAGLIRCGEDDRITSGEFLMLVMDCGANEVVALKKKGAPIDHALLEDAAVVHNRYGAVPVNSESPNAATLFVAYLETPEAQAALWELDGLDFYLFPESNSRHATDEIRKAGGKLALDSPQWLDSVPNFSATQKQLGDILAHGG